MKPTTIPYSRYSTVMPNGGFPPSYPFSEPTPLLPGPSSPQYISQPPSRRMSPVVNELLPNLSASLSPGPVAADINRASAVSQASHELLARMLEQQAHLHNYSIVYSFTILSRTKQSRIVPTIILILRGISASLKLPRQYLVVIEPI